MIYYGCLGLAPQQITKWMKGESWTLFHCHLGLRVRPLARTSFIPPDPR